MADQLVHCLPFSKAISQNQTSEVSRAALPVPGTRPRRVAGRLLGLLVSYFAGSPVALIWQPLGSTKCTSSCVIDGTMMLDTTTEERRAARRRRRERLASHERDVNVRGIVAAGVAAMTLLGLSHHLLLPDTADAGSHHLRRPLEQEAPFRGSRASSDAFGHHVFVDHTHGLVVCAIPKVGSTELARLILRMGNSSHWRRDPQRSALAVADRDRHLVSKLSLQRAQALVDDRRYTWAVFFRDPAHRLLSAYRNRILGRGVNGPSRTSSHESV